MRLWKPQKTGSPTKFFFMEGGGEKTVKQKTRNFKENTPTITLKKNGARGDEKTNYVWPDSISSELREGSQEGGGGKKKKRTGTL